MALFLLSFSVALLFAFFYCTGSGSGPYTRTRFAFLYTLLANAALVYSYNEIASFFDAVNSTSAIAFWVLVVLAEAGGVFYLHKKARINLSQLTGVGQVFGLAGVSRSGRIIILLAVSFYLLPLLFLAIYAPPNNYDSHMYHLHRIMAWINNGNLDHFPTMHLQQLYLNVFAEYLVLNTVLLSGGDHFGGLIQYSAFLASLAAITLLAKRLGMNQRGQLVAAIFLLTLPIAIFESTSTQVDYCACFFFIAYVMFGFELLAKRSNVVLSAFLLSLAFGGFSKYTIFIFAIPFTVYFAIRILLQYKIAYAAKVLAIALIFMIVVFGPFFYRNYTLFGHVMHPLRGTVFASEELPANKHGLKFTLSGIMKNAGLNLGLPSTAFNQAMETGILRFHDVIGVDVNDSDLSIDPFAVRYSVQEDMVPNTIHFWLIIIATLFVFFTKGSRDVKWLWACALASFILFCTLMKFQAWSTRTQMPFFTMGAILIAYLYSVKLSWRPVFIALPLLLLSSVFVYGNPSKELLSINFLTRKAIGHIPIAICENGGEEAVEYEKYLGAFYEFPGKDNCHPLKTWPAYADRQKIFGLLEQVGYYDLDKSSNIIAMPREKAYFLAHPPHYDSYKPLLDQIEGDNKNVGIFFKKNVGFYHYWSAIGEHVAKPGQMDYIRYNKELSVLKNAQKPFCYDYIFSDDEDLLEAFIKPENIDTIYTNREFQLVKLKKPGCEKSLF